MIAGPEPTPAVIRARAPLRIDVGGNLFAAITPAVHVEAHLGGRTIRIRTDDQQQRVTLPNPAAIRYDGQLDRPKAALNMLPVTGGIELLIRTDAAKDAGLGLVGALDVALLAALALCRQETYGAGELADLALMLESQELQATSPAQDAYLAAFGGVQSLTYRGGRIEGRAVPVPAARLTQLAAQLILIPLGRAFVSGAATNPPAPASAAHEANAAAEALVSGDITRLALSFEASWQRQRGLDPLLSAPHTNTLALAARGAGARALKATSTGEGGSLLILCDAGARPGVEAALRARGADPLPFGFDPEGVRAWVEGGELS